ncbi:MAG: hypothetical protein NC548_02610 [Lachnospiraceae bacterium]|nr:hypothetical protein [Lachnospiraceae bacterium]
MAIVNENRPVRPHIQNLDKLSQSELFQIARNDHSSPVSVQCLTELLSRLFEEKRELTARLEQFEQKDAVQKAASTTSKKRCGRKQQAFYVDGAVLDDEQLVYLIDNEFYTIRELERETGAGKNQLRRRYERYKEKRRKDRKPPTQNEVHCQKKAGRFRKRDSGFLLAAGTEP